MFISSTHAAHRLIPVASSFSAELPFEAKERDAIALVKHFASAPVDGGDNITTSKVLYRLKEKLRAFNNGKDLVVVRQSHINQLRQEWGDLFFTFYDPTDPETLAAGVMQRVKKICDSYGYMNDKNNEVTQAQFKFALHDSDGRFAY